MFAVRIKYKIQRVWAPHIVECRKHSYIHHTHTDARSVRRFNSLASRLSSWALRVLHWLRCRCFVQIPRRPFSLVCLSWKPNNNFNIESFFPVLCVLVVFFFILSLCLPLSLSFSFIRSFVWCVCSSREHRRKWTKSKSGNIKQSNKNERQWQKYRRYNIIL